MTPAHKRYRLKKDINSPKLVAYKGEVGVLIDNNKVFFDNGRYFYYRADVEQIPEWFELITEPSIGKWSDEAMQSFAYWYKNLTAPVKDPLEEWKQSKSTQPERPNQNEIFCGNCGNPTILHLAPDFKCPSTPPKERVEVVDFDKRIGPPNGRYEVRIGGGQTIPKEKFPAIKAAIEKVINQ